MKGKHLNGCQRQTQLSDSFELSIKKDHGLNKAPNISWEWKISPLFWGREKKETSREWFEGSLWILVENVLLHWSNDTITEHHLQLQWHLGGNGEEARSGGKVTQAGLRRRRSSHRQTVKAKTSAAALSSTLNFPRTSWRVSAGLVMNLFSNATTSVFLYFLAISRAV